MTDDEFQKLDLEKHAAKSLALYREKIRPLVYRQLEGGWTPVSSCTTTACIDYPP